MGKICTFFCQDDVSLGIEPLIEKQIRKLINNENVDTFWIGGNGWFDIYASGVLKKLAKEFPNITVISTNLKNKNEKQMYSNADYIIVFATQKYEEFYNVLKTLGCNEKNIIYLKFSR